MIHNILVLDAAQRSSLAVTRSLGKLSDLCIHTADHNSNNLAGSSKYSAHTYVCPDPNLDPDQFINWLAELTGKVNFSLVIPVTEVSSQLILIRKADLPHVRLPFSDLDRVMQLANKANLMSIAESLSIKIPKTLTLNNCSEIDFQTLEFPVVIKPSLSKIYTPEKWIGTTVKIAHSLDQLKDILVKNPHLHTHTFLLQEFIPGKGAGIFCLYEHGGEVVFFAHRRLREKPPEGGVSVLSESISVDPNLRDISRKLLSAANWHGVAMVEFRIAPDGTAYLMEVNTRFWGSLQLSIDSGIDFPKILVSKELNLPIEVPVHYKLGQKLRWFLGDLDSLYLYLRAKHSFNSKIARIYQFAISSFSNSKQEIFRADDIKPAISELKTYLSQLLKLSH